MGQWDEFNSVGWCLRFFESQKKLLNVQFGKKPVPSKMGNSDTWNVFSVRHLKGLVDEVGDDQIKFEIFQLLSDPVRCVTQVVLKICSNPVKVRRTAAVFSP